MGKKGPQSVALPSVEPETGTVAGTHRASGGLPSRSSEISPLLLLCGQCHLLVLKISFKIKCFGSFNMQQRQMLFQSLFSTKPPLFLSPSFLPLFSPPPTPTPDPPTPDPRIRLGVSSSGSTPPHRMYLGRCLPLWPSLEMSRG